MTALQDLDQAEVDFRAHCRENYEAPGKVYAEDSALIEHMARKIMAFAEGLEADFRDLHTSQDAKPSAAGIAQLVTESLDWHLRGSASLLYAQVKYLGSKAAGVAQKEAA